MITEFEIEHHFIAKFKDTHGEPPEGKNFAKSIEGRAPKNATVLSLETAAERLIRTKKAKTFPSFPDCLNAIIEASRHDTPQATPGAVAKIVMPENYAAMALDHMRLHGSYGSLGCMIEPGSPEWGLWVAYFIAKSIPAKRMASIEAFARRPAIEGQIQWIVTDRYMVPARYPMEFDASAPSVPTTWAEETARRNRSSRCATAQGANAA